MKSAFWIVLAIASPPALVHADSEAPRLYPIEVRNPPSLGEVDTGLVDARGLPIGIPCATCHDPNDDGALTRMNDVPQGFHGGVEVSHGTLRCASCHDPEDRTRLRLADGQTLAMDEVIELCGQCHGPKYRDFWKGSHGGGRGYWDRKKGPWIRNNCVSCHSPHAPAYPTVMPAPPPNDRFLDTKSPHPQDKENTRHD
jgi:hypothetical protein